jgi:hypothetical protein
LRKRFLPVLLSAAAMVAEAVAVAVAR